MRTLADDEEYDEVEAIVRIPKGGSLADSKKTEGWSRGFTPKSADKGPEHVEIRLKGTDEDSAKEWVLPDPISADGHVDPPREKTREQEELEELLQLLVMLGFIQAVEWAQPRLMRLWEERVVPFFVTKRERLLERKGKRRASSRRTVEKPDEVTESLAAYEVSMTSDEARAHFVQALFARHFANEKLRLLENARIADDTMPAELFSAVRALTARDVENALESILKASPGLVNDLGGIIHQGRGDGLRLLDSDRVQEALLLTENNEHDPHQTSDGSETAG